MLSTFKCSCVCVCTENKCSLALTGFMLRWRENYTANALFVICLSISAASAKYTFSITCVCKMHFIWACERRIHKYVISYNFLKICTFLHTCTKIAHIDKPRYLHIIYIYIYMHAGRTEYEPLRLYANVSEGL